MAWLLHNKELFLHQVLLILQDNFLVQHAEAFFIVFLFFIFTSVGIPKLVIYIIYHL